MTPDQFWNAVDQSGGPDACWPWTRGLALTGYGAVRLNGQFMHSHRAAFLLTHGRRIAEAMYACHTCDNRACCNPSHIYEGTPLDNNRDMTDRGRADWQTKTHCAKGHPWIIGNKMPIKGTVWHRCRECFRIKGREASRRYAAKKKEAARG